jgi:hypothetical protein
VLTLKSADAASWPANRICRLFTAGFAGQATDPKIFTRRTIRSASGAFQPPGGTAMKENLTPRAVTAMLLLALVTPTAAQQDADEEAPFLQTFEGRFAGEGKLERPNGSVHDLSCKFDGDQKGSRVTLNGSCSTALIISTTIRIELRYNPKTQRYDGEFREGKGTVADLAGARRGESLTLSFRETEESVRPDPPATLTISRKGDGLAITLRRSQPGEGRNLDLTLKAI